MTDIAKLVSDVAQEADASRHDDTELFGKGKRSNRETSQMLSVRIPVDTYDELERQASKMDVPMSSLVRGYIIAGLAEQTESITQTLHRVAQEVDKLRRLVGA